MAMHLYEFLYRGRPTNSAEPPAYHVILADDGTDAFGQPTYALSPALTPEQAKSRGFGLPELMAEINVGAMAENTALKAKVADLNTTVDVVTKDAQLMKADLSEQISNLKAEIARMATSIPDIA